MLESDARVTWKPQQKEAEITQHEFGGAKAETEKSAILYARCQPKSANVAYAQAGAAEQAQAQDPATKATLSDAVAQAPAKDASDTAVNATTTPTSSSATSAPTDTAPHVQALSDKFLTRSNVDPQEIANSTLPESVKAQVTGSTNRVDMLQKLAQVVKTQGANSSDGLAAASYHKDQIEQHYTHTESDPKAFEALSDDSLVGKLRAQYEDFSDQLAQSPAIVQAFGKVRGLTQDQVSTLIKPVTEERLATPEGQQNVANATLIAALTPDQGNLGVNRDIVDPTDRGKLTLTPNQIGALRASVPLMPASRDATDAQKPLGHEKPINSVSHARLESRNSSESRLRPSVHVLNLKKPWPSCVKAMFSSSQSWIA
jgi:hypothetical protein